LSPLVITLLLLLGFACIILAFIGAIFPGIPGLPVALIAFAILHFSGLFVFHGWMLTLLMAFVLLVVVMSVLDYLLPSMMAKWFGGSKYASWGSNIALILCVFISTPLGPFAIVVGPFLGAYIGEIYAKKTNKEALKSALGTLLGFLVGTSGKLILTGFIGVFYIILCFSILARISSN